MANPRRPHAYLVRGFVISDEVPRWADKNARIYRLQGKVAFDELCRIESLGRSVSAFCVLSDLESPLDR